MTFTNIILIAVVVVQSVLLIISDQELKTWQKECYEFGYADAAVDQDGHVTEYQLIPTRGRSGVPQAASVRRRQFIQVEPENPDYGGEIEHNKS